MTHYPRYQIFSSKELPGPNIIIQYPSTVIYISSLFQCEGRPEVWPSADDVMQDRNSSDTQSKCVAEIVSTGSRRAHALEQEVPKI